MTIYSSPSLLFSLLQHECVDDPPSTSSSSSNVLGKKAQSGKIHDDRVIIDDDETELEELEHSEIVEDSDVVLEQDKDSQDRSTVLVDEEDDFQADLKDQLFVSIIIDFLANTMFNNFNNYITGFL